MGKCPDPRLQQSRMTDGSVSRPWTALNHSPANDGLLCETVNALSVNADCCSCNLCQMVHFAHGPDMKFTHFLAHSGKGRIETVVQFPSL